MFLAYRDDIGPLSDGSDDHKRGRNQVKAGGIKRILSIPTPYNVRESIGWLVRNLAGPGRRNAGIVKFIPAVHILNEGVKPEYKAAFVGDIMPMHRKRMKFDSDVKQFVSECDCLVGNFAGTIIETRKKTALFTIDQVHNPQIVKMLSNFFPPEKTYLSVANNHAGDFGREVFLKSVAILRSGGFNLFGWNECLYADINANLRMISGTAWSNRECSYVCRLHEATRYIKKDAFNIFYPHFGYELELYPRPETVKLGKSLVEKFDAVIGSHSHCPQPVTEESKGAIKKLLAYSLGDFCTGLKMKKYQYGIVLKAELGRDSEGRSVPGKVEWRLTRCAPLPDGDFLVSIVKNYKDFFNKVK